MRILIALFGLSMATVACMSDGKPRPDPERESGSCMISGCSGELCGTESLVSPCIWRDEYACYQNATCDRQRDGTCGWTATHELTSCLAAYVR
jgi:eight-cysteine-cluster-containing protein